MKRLLIVLCVLGVILAGAVPVFAGSPFARSNMSAEYLGIYNRNAATDHADIVAYNPAGTVKFKDGFYGNLSGQFFFKKYNNEFTTALGSTHETTEPSYIPEAYAVYKKGPWAAFFGLNVPLGGGKVKYEEGNLTSYQLGTLLALGYRAALLDPTISLSSHQVMANNYAIGYTLGGAYQINDMFSISAGLRYISSEVDFEGGVKYNKTLPFLGKNADYINFKAKAKGWGGIFGLDIFPNDKTTVGIRYETATALEYDYEVVQDTANVLPGLNIRNGDRKRDDLPAALGTGVGYQITPELRGEVNLTWYFNKAADVGGTSLRENPDNDGVGLEGKINDTWEAGIGLTYAFTDTVKGNIGYLYTSIGVDPKYSSKFSPDLNSHAIGLGCQWTMMKDLDLTIGGGNVFYVSDSYTDTYLRTRTGGLLPTQDVKYSKSVPFFGLGLEYKFF